jgi:membrane protein YqaA with SNARE-associated domain
MKISAGLVRHSRAVFDGWVSFASSWRGVAVVFLWAVAEATVWPVIPDFLLAPMVVGNRRRFHVPLAAAALGSAIGGACLYFVAYWAPDQTMDFIRRLPFVSDGQMHEAARRLMANGAWAFFLQPWSGIAFKVWVAAAASEHISPWLAIPAFTVGRAIRMTIVATVTRILAGWLSGFVRDFSIFVLAVYLGLFFYGWWQVVNR